MISKLVTIFLNNMPLIIVITIGVIVYKSYKELKEYRLKIQNSFDKTLAKYLDEKIKKARLETDEILKEYGREDEVATEITRLLAVMEKCENGTINEKVAASNAVNKFKINKKAVEKYPNLEKLNEMKTFTEEEMKSLDNGLSIARQEYNTLAFRYNEKASGLVQQLIIKVIKIPSAYIIFDALESQKYEQNFEVFQEEEPEVANLSELNLGEPEKVDLEEIKNTADRKEIRHDHASDILKPELPKEKEDFNEEEDEEYQTVDTR